MLKEKIYTGRINITESKVFIDTDINYSAIEINYIGNLAITSLLPEYFMMSKGNNKILIVKFQKNDIITSDLFEYTGQCLITKSYIYSNYEEKHSLIINKPSLELWNTLASNWEDLTNNWEDIDFEGRNDDIKSLNIKNIYDESTNSYTTEREYITKPSNIAKKSRYSGRLSGLTTNGLEYKKATNNEAYTGSYYVNLITKEVFTDGGDLLIPIKSTDKIRKGISYGTRASSDNYTG